METIREGLIKRIHINRQKILQKASDPISVQLSRKVVRARSVDINGPSRLVYDPKNPLSSGAKLWIETESEVVVYK